MARKKKLTPEQMAKDIPNPCDHHECRECMIRGACNDHEKALGWLGQEHAEDGR